MVEISHLIDYAYSKRLTSDLIFEVVKDISDMSKPWSYKDSYLESNLFSKSFRDIVKSNNIQETINLKNKLEIWISYIKLNNLIKIFHKDIWEIMYDQLNHSKLPISDTLSTPYSNYINFSLEKDYYYNIIFTISSENKRDHIALSFNANQYAEKQLVLKSISATEAVAESLLHCFSEVFKNNKKSVLDLL